MEGYFWRVTDVPRRRVLVVLCGVNRHPDGDWATVAVAAEPGAFVRAAVVPGASDSTDGSMVAAGDGVLTADQHRVRVRLGEDARVDLWLADLVGWPLALGGGGVFSALPFLGQYWHPHVLGGAVAGTACLGGEEWVLDGADVYSEKNWGAGFPERWWWGQAQGFDRRDVCVAFSGGVLTAGPLSASVGGVVVRVGADVIRFAPPLATVRTAADGRRWQVSARRPGSRVRIDGWAVGEPHVLPVPLPSARRNADTDYEHLAGHLSLEVSGPAHYRGTSHLAGLEIGHRPT